LIFLRLLWRGFQQRGYWRHLQERCGAFPRFDAGHCIWIHAVSVGEMRAAQPLVRRLRLDYPAHPVLLSCMTVTGRETARELYGDDVTCVYLPYDFFMLQSRLITHFHPRLLLVMETEIWPNLLAACHAHGVPALLVNARMSEKSSRGYARFAPIRQLVRSSLASLHAVAAQSSSDASRLAALGARNPVVTGNIKFDVAVDSALVARGQAWRLQLPAAKRVLLAASTRDGEETILLDAYRQLRANEAGANILLVLVPRHPQRFESVFQLVKSAGFNVDRRTLTGPSDELHVWLGDSMGEMAAYIAVSDVAFIGGSLLPLGGQNLIEACAQGKPVVMGPSTYNFSDASRLALEAGAMQQGEDAQAVMNLAGNLLLNDALRAEASDAARKFAAVHAGATEKTMGLIAPLLNTGS
ncbi:MAG: 3-deoxy-D-manno-octulosonic acid transferase, partial [Betaproteobacteria bacterium]